jgi:thymidylate kinase
MMNYLWLLNMDCRQHSAWIDRILRSIARRRSLMFVYIKIVPKEAAARVQARSSMDTAFDRQDAEVNGKIFSSHGSYFDELADRLVKYGASVFVLDGETGIQEKVEAICCWMSERPTGLSR